MKFICTLSTIKCATTVPKSSLSVIVTPRLGQRCSGWTVEMSLSRSNWTTLIAKIILLDIFSFIVCQKAKVNGKSKSYRAVALGYYFGVLRLVVG